VPVYLDHAADAPRHPATAEAMLPWLTERFGNPSGSHQVARRARAAVDDARDRVASFLGVEPAGVVFTSGGTEADNLALLGPLADRPGAVVVSAVQLVNQETGVIQPLAELARLVRKRAPNAVLHTDAVQGAAWLALTELTAAADLVSISGHKFGGPQGIGALGVRGGLGLTAITYGGGQERERRSGSHDVAAIAGLGAAVDVVASEREARRADVARRRDRLAAAVREALPGTVWTAEASPRAPGHLHLRFPGVESEALLFLLDEAGVCASAGSACASGAVEPSPVLLAMGVDKQEAASSLRLTLGPGTTDSDVDEAARVIAAAVRALR
jgi:cysteine desulfurase